MIQTEKLREIMARRGMSQREVAKHLGMAEKTFYSKMKNGVFGTDEVDKMIDFLEIDHPWDIFFAKK